MSRFGVVIQVLDKNLFYIIFSYHQKNNLTNYQRARCELGTTQVVTLRLSNCLQLTKDWRKVPGVGISKKILAMGASGELFRMKINRFPLGSF
jgi:hypothetical protein